jgi:hypothetical protein
MAAQRPPRHSHPPGTFWYYNNWDFNTLGTISDQLFALLANCQLGAARKHMQDLIAARVKLPTRPPDEARDATDAAAEIKRLDLAWRLLGRLGEITSDHLADGVSAEGMNNHRTFLVLGRKRRASVR